MIKELNPEKTRKSHKKLILICVIAALVIAGIIGGVCWYIFGRDSEPQTANLEQVEDVTEAMEQLIESDVSQPGFYTYEYEEGTLALLTYGETVGLSMNVTPNIDGMSVYFAVSATRVVITEPALEYRLYYTNAESLSADVPHLKNPAYGTGAEGMNIGWIVDNGGGEYYMTPLLDTLQIDRVFFADTNVEVQTGLCQFEYRVADTAAYITACKPVEEQTLYMKVSFVDRENQQASLLTAIDEVRVTVSILQLKEDDVQTLEDSAGQESAILITLVDKDGVLSVASLDLPKAGGNSVD